MTEKITGAELRLCMPRNEIPTEDIIALAHELMRFQPTDFKSTRKRGSSGGSAAKPSGNSSG